MSEKVLVTGGGGFLGTAIALLHQQRGDQVRIFGRRHYPHLEKHEIEQHQGDLRNPEAVERACRGMELVHHCAAYPGVWGESADFFAINLQGSRHVINACQRLSISRLVYTSSPSVVHTGSDITGLDESRLPYTECPYSAYSASKSKAEKEILAAHSSPLFNGGTLNVVALRPHLIWGPGDPNLIPRIIARGRSGRLKQVGQGKNRVDAVYIDNAASAQLLAADQLKNNPQTVGGKAYFITNGEPVVLWDFINHLLAAAGVAPVRRSIPFKVAWWAGFLLERVYRLAGIKQEPLMTRFLAEQLAHHHWFNIDAARQDLGYHPRVSMEEGLQRTTEWMRETGLA